MQPLENESNLSAEACAELVADTVPLVMRTIRAEMRRHRKPDLSVPQFRTLGYLRRHPGASLSQVAEHIGLTLPSISRMIDRLEKQALLSRANTPSDRRRISLKLTAQGEAALRTADKATRERLAERLGALSVEDRLRVLQAMSSLRTLFGTEPQENGSQSDNSDNNAIDAIDAIDSVLDQLDQTED